MKVIIVGSGLLGLTTAYYLRRGGAEVCVVDRRPGPGLETSFANGGMLHASQANPWNEPGILGAAIKMLGREDAALLIRAKALPAMLSMHWRKFATTLRSTTTRKHLARSKCLELKKVLRMR